MTVTFDNTRRDMVAVYVHIFSRRMPRLVAIMAVAGAATSAALADWTASPTESIKYVVAVAVLTPCVLVAIGLGLLLLVAATGKWGEAIGERTLTITDQAIVETTRTNSHTTHWQGVTAVARTRGLIVVSFGTGVYAIPRRAFGSQDEWDRLYQTILDAYKAACG